MVLNGPDGKFKMIRDFADGGRQIILADGFADESEEMKLFIGEITFIVHNLYIPYICMVCQELCY